MKTIDKLSYFTSIVKGRIFHQNIPISISLSVTNRCDFRCIYCYVQSNKHSTRDFTTEELLNLIDELSLIGTKFIHIIGGEPLLRNDIEIIIDKIKSKKMICVMNSNGSLVAKRINAIKKLDSITISLDGSKEANDKNRGSGTFEKIMDAIYLIKKNNVRLNTVTVITKNNINEIEKILDMAKKIGFTTEYNLLYEQTPEADNNPALQLTNEDVKYVLNKLIAYQKQGEYFSFSVVPKIYAFNWPFDYRKRILFADTPINFKIIPCYMGNFMCHIDADGLVYPCGQLIGQFPAMNLLEVGFKEAWENTLLKKRCITCYNICFNEYNLIFNLRLKTIIKNFVRTVKLK